MKPKPTNTDYLKWEAYFIMYVILLPLFLLILALYSYFFGYRIWILKLGILSTMPYIFMMLKYMWYVIEEQTRLFKVKLKNNVKHTETDTERDTGV